MDSTGEVLIGQCYAEKLLPSFHKDYLPQLHKETSASAGTSCQVWYADETVAYKKLGGLLVYVLGPQSINELFLCDVLTSVCDGISSATDNNETSAGVKEMYSQVTIILAEIIDQGVYLTNEVPRVCSNISEKTTLAGALDGARFIAKTLLS